MILSGCNNVEKLGSEDSNFAGNCMWLVLYEVQNFIRNLKKNHIKINLKLKFKILALVPFGTLISLKREEQQ